MPTNMSEAYSLTCCILFKLYTNKTVEVTICGLGGGGELQELYLDEQQTY